MPRRLRPLAGVSLGVAVAAVLLASTGGGGSRPAAVHAAASSWAGLVGSPRPQVAVGQRVIVLLKARSLADRVERAGGFARDSDERRWTAISFAAQQQFISDLAERGIRIRPEFRFTRVLNGFSALLDAGAGARLERAREVRGVYPVRAAYPAAISRRSLGQQAFRRGFGHRADVSLGGADGLGVTIALLDTGVDVSTPFLHGHVLDGFDVAGDGPDARARANPDDPEQLESHGTEMAGILVGSGGPSALAGVASGATVLPIRVAGWQRDATGGWGVYARTDQILAGLERAVDPNANGDAHDAARIALVPLVEPFAAFGDDPLARACAGALRLDTLVVVPAGNDGPAGPAFGSVSGPGGAPAALTVGAGDLRRRAPAVRLVVRAGLKLLLDRVAPLAGLAAPDRTLALELVPFGSSSALFDKRGFSLADERAALVPGGRSLRRVVEAAATAGARAVVVAGSVPTGALGLDERVHIPVVAVPKKVARAVARAVLEGAHPMVVIGAPRMTANEEAERVAAFSSRGLAFSVHPKPELVASGVTVTTAEPGSTAAGGSRFTTINGSSAAAATVAGAAALLLDARPSLSAAKLRSILIAAAHPLPGEPLHAQGTGLLDVGAAAATEVVTEPATIAFGRATGADWQRTVALVVRNVSSRRLTLYVAAPQRRRPRVLLEVSPARLEVPPGGAAAVKVRARVVGAPVGSAAGGMVTITPLGGATVRVPWAAVLAPAEGLLGPPRLSAKSFRPSATAQAVVDFRVGRVVRLASAEAIEPVLRLDIELYPATGRRLGLIARLRDLLPGRYTFGLTGRGPNGRALKPGRYRLRLVAWPAAGGTPSVESIGFEIRKGSSP